MSVLTVNQVCALSECCFLLRYDTHKCAYVDSDYLVEENSVKFSELSVYPIVRLQIF